MTKTLNNRIHALLEGWADAGDDLPEHLLVITEMQRRMEEAREALYHYENCFSESRARKYLEAAKKLLNGRWT